MRWLIITLVALMLFGCGEKASEKSLGVWQLTNNQDEFIEITPDLLIVNKTRKYPLMLIDKESAVAISEVDGHKFIFLFYEGKFNVSSKLLGSGFNEYVRADKKMIDEIYSPTIDKILGYWSNKDGRDFIELTANKSIVINDDEITEKVVKYTPIIRGFMMIGNETEQRIKLVDGNLEIDGNYFVRVPAAEGNKIKTEKIALIKKRKKEIATKLANLNKEIAAKLASLDKTFGVWMEADEEKDNHELKKPLTYLEVNAKEIKISNYGKLSTYAITGRTIKNNTPVFITKNEAQVFYFDEITNDNLTFNFRQFRNESKVKFRKTTAEEIAAINKPTLENLAGFWIKDDEHEQFENHYQVLEFSNNYWLRDGRKEIIITDYYDTERILSIVREFNNNEKEKKKKTCAWIRRLDKNSISVHFDTTDKPACNYRQATEEDAKNLLVNSPSKIPLLYGFWRSKNKYEKGYIYVEIAVVDNSKLLDGITELYDGKIEQITGVLSYTNREYKKDYNIYLVHYRYDNYVHTQPTRIINKDTIEIDDRGYKIIYERISEAEAKPLIDAKKKQGIK